MKTLKYKNKDGEYVSLYDTYTPVGEYEKGSISPQEALACDVVLVNKNTLKKVIVREIDAEKYPPSDYEPIGIVVIPGSHGVLKDGTGTINHCGIISLVPMSYNTPEVGAISETGMCWGGYNSDITGKSDGLGRYDSITNGLIDYQKVACDTSGTNTSTRLSNGSYDGYLPRQGSTGGKPTWNSSTSSYGYIPSPYNGSDLMSGGYNESYGTTKFDIGGTNQNALADFKGIQNTKIITDLATSEDWKTLSSITNNSGSGYYPVACCCARFHTTGTKVFKDCSNEELRKGIGFWYLPACGELGYIIPRLYDINDTISKLKTAYGVGVQLNASNYYWSSSEYSTNYARNMGTTSGIMSFYNKSSDLYVRAFCQLG